MSFDSPLFFALCLLTFALVRSLPQWQGAVLLTASLLCYSAAGATDVGIVVITVVLNYGLSWGVARSRAWLVAAVVVNIGTLAFFKYRHFLFPALAAEAERFYQGDILIPLGISFYIFQAIAYQVDLGSGRTRHIRSPWQFALFILLFMQVVAGPIVRAGTLGPQVARAFRGVLRPRRPLGLALAWCVMGLIKKVVIADSLAPHVDTIFALGPADSFTAWLGAVLFGFQIYFDFSGYCDIAIGVGQLFGFSLPLNFKQPYLSTNPRDFWQRWHITLSTWFRDYLYIPLGGSRAGGATRHLVVLVVTMALAGLWHGANATFIVWGLGWGLYIAVWRRLGPAVAGLGTWWWIPHMMIVFLLWVFFRASSVPEAVSFIGAMFGSPAGDYHAQLDLAGKVLSVIGIAGLMLIQIGEAWITDVRRVTLLRRWDGRFLHGALVGLIFWLVISPKPVSNPFIYFRF